MSVIRRRRTNRRKRAPRDWKPLIHRVTRTATQVAVAAVLVIVAWGALILLVDPQTSLLAAGGVPVFTGGTGLIGDPGGKTEERSLNPAETVVEWSEKFKKQLEP